MHCTLTLELSQNIEAEIVVYFTCTDEGYPGDRIDPPCAPEFEIIDVEVESVFGANYDKSRAELLEAGFARDMDEQAWIVVEDYSELYDHQLDAYEDEGC